MTKTENINCTYLEGEGCFWQLAQDEVPQGTDENVQAWLDKNLRRSKCPNCPFGDNKTTIEDGGIKPGE